jgi:hypothetical protein
MVTSIIGKDAAEVQSIWGLPARRLAPQQRLDLSLEVLVRRESLCSLSRREGVSRKFLYQQGAKGRRVLEEAFAPSSPEEERILFHLPVTKNWIRQFVLAQVLLGHTSFRGVMEILDSVLDYREISLGTIHNIVAEALPRARAANEAMDLSAIRVGAHDEIYQARRPVLVGADVPSTYCYLLAEEDHCDETTWGVHLLDLQRQGLHPDYTVADGGLALRAGQAAAWENVPCHGDVFHAERELGTLATYLERRVGGCSTARQKLERQLRRRKPRPGRNPLKRRLEIARQAEAAAATLAGEVRILSDWLQKDILALAGPALATRRELFDFVVRELAEREPHCPHRLGPVRRMLQAHRDHLLAFVGVLEERFGELGRRWGVPAFLVQEVCELEGMDLGSAAHWRQEGRLCQRLGRKLRPLQEAVRQVLADTPRASSVIENLNSRLRSYFFLRKEIGNDYLALRRFFLNHHRFLRSECPDRVGKSPAELLGGRSHAHWLELLGFRRFHRN